MKRILWYITIAAALFTLYMVAQSYGLFETKGTGSASENVAVWSIKLNNVDISKGVTDNFVINTVTYSTNNNVEDGYIAPGRTGYFDIVVDPSGTQVSVRYDITIDLTSLTYPDDITFSVTNPDGTSATRTAVSTYTGVIDLAQIAAGNTVTLRLTINWANDGTHDSADSSLGTTPNNKISVPVNVDIKQYLGEEITPYQ